MQIKLIPNIFFVDSHCCEVSLICSSVVTFSRITTSRCRKITKYILRAWRYMQGYMRYWRNRAWKFIVNFLHKFVTTPVVLCFQRITFILFLFNVLRKVYINYISQKKKLTQKCRRKFALQICYRFAWRLFEIMILGNYIKCKAYWAFYYEHKLMLNSFFLFLRLINFSL